MPITVEIPEHGASVEFPDGTSPEVMQAAMQKQFGVKKQSPPPPPQTSWEKAKGVVGQIWAEPAKLAAEAVYAPVQVGYKALTNFSRVIPAQVKALYETGDSQAAKSAGEEARRNIGTLPNLPFQSKISELIGKHIIEPGARGAAKLLGWEPETVNQLVEATGELLAMAGLKPGISAAKGATNAAVKALADTGLPEKLYSGATKLPLSRAWTKQIGEEGMTKRKQAISAGLEGEVPISELGIEKARNLEKTFRNQVDSVIQQLDQNGTLIPKDRLQAGLSAAQDVADVEGTAYAQKVVDRMYDKRFEKMGRMVQTGERQIPEQFHVDEFGQKIVDAPATIEPIMERQYSPSEMQKIKRHLYKMEDYEKAKLSRGMTSQIKELANKGMAHEAKIALEELHPELKALNAQDASYINLIEALERAVPRINNKDLLGLGAKVLATGTHPYLSIIEHALGLPSVKAKAAFALNRARKIQSSTDKALNAGLATSGVIAEESTNESSNQ